MATCKESNMKQNEREQFHLVVVGHVDHGKSTVIGRLLADTGSLPDGKLDKVRQECARTAKPFEYAFLLDALKAEQAQGITIDTARSFFKSATRDYIIIDAPGHIEFLKNMITGAARAEAAVLIIDAKEGVRENSRRHGTMLSLLGIRQVVVVVNKMDLVDYRQEVFEAIREEYQTFLARLGIQPLAFLPLAAFHGENLIAPSPQMPWFSGPPLLAQIDQFRKEALLEHKPFRLPVQDVYKFTEEGDDRRITAGRIESGQIRPGTPVVFYPSRKSAVVKSFEEFNRDTPALWGPGKSAGFTLEPELYVRPGELMTVASEPAPAVANRFRANIFWMGKAPLLPGKKYKLKMHTAEAPVWIEEILSVLDASDLSSGTKKQVDQHEVAECVLETAKNVAFDLSTDLAPTGRFVLVDEWEIAGGGIILQSLGEEHRLLERHLAERERNWDRSPLTPGLRSGRYGQRSAFVLLSGSDADELFRLGRALEEKLFLRGRYVYYLGLSSALSGLQADLAGQDDRWEFLRRLGEAAHLFTDAGTILITAVPDLDAEETNLLSRLANPTDLFTVEAEQGVDTETQVNNITRRLQESNILVDWVL